MSLGARLNILITLLFVAIFIGAAAIVINNARSTVREETEASAQHTIQLIEVLLKSGVLTGLPESQQRLLDNLNNLGASRHLQILVRPVSDSKPGIEMIGLIEIQSSAPQWFTRLVYSKPLDFQRTVDFPDREDVEIIVVADPSAEITETWYETRNVLFFVILFITLANLLLYFTLRRYLAPLESILTGLERIEQGDYNLRLPEYKLPELNRISERFNHMADVLLESREENRILTQKNLAIQENERRHLARELHDELGQSLSAIKAVAVSIEQKSTSENEAIAENARAIGAFSERMYEVARNMMQRLRPSILDELGLTIAIQSLADEWNQSHGESFCHLELGGDLEDLGEDNNINLYRIIQESLTNVSKHADASEVFIRLNRSNSTLQLIIQDNGVGVDMPPKKGGLGLPGMQERVEALGGEFVLTGGIQKGFSIEIKLPLTTVEAVTEN